MLLNKIMDVVFAVNQAFFRPLIVAIVSLLENNKTNNIVIHILYMDLGENEKQTLRGVVEKYLTEVRFYQISPAQLRNFPNPGMYSLASYFRLLIPAILDERINRVLYLDCDLIINGDLKDLWNTDIQDYSVAAVSDTTLSHSIIKDYIDYDFRREGYFNSGVLVINLKYWREHSVQESLSSYLVNHQTKLNDQDALNSVLHGTAKFIHPKWNCHTGYFAYPPLVITEQKKYIKYLWAGARIIHFTGPVKPWYKECVNPYKSFYKKYEALTPWGITPDRFLEKNVWASHRIIFLRKCKNVVARLASYIY